MDPFLAEIRMFPFNFAPQGWAFCDGQLLPISQNTALFSLLGTNYGGDGKSTFALPNLQGSVAIGWGQGQGLSLYDLGQSGGASMVTLLQSEIPAHTHSLQATTNQGNQTTPSATTALASCQAYAPLSGNSVYLNTQAIAPAGGSQPHDNMQPYLTVNYCIALQGVYPQRT